LPGVISRAVSGVKKAAGRDFFAASRPASTIRLRTAGLSSVRPFFFSSGVSSGGTISSRKQGMPAFARCAAMRAPIVPAPITAVFSIRFFVIVFHQRHIVTRLLLTGQQRHRVRTCKPPSHSETQLKRKCAKVF